MRQRFEDSGSIITAPYAFPPREIHCYGMALCARKSQILRIVVSRWLLQYTVQYLDLNPTYFFDINESSIHGNFSHMAKTES